MRQFTRAGLQGARLAQSSAARPVRPFHASSVAARGTFFEDVEVKDGVAIVRFDGPEKMNVLAEGMGPELEALWDKDVANNSDVKAVVFTSSKPDNFIAGADIKMLKKLRSDPPQLLAQVEGMHRLSEKMKAANKPIVAAIHGVCMGGGLEMALFADYRVATNHKKTVLSVPEIKLGLFPGGGGTQNLYPLVGVQEAIKMMTTGGNVRPAKAIKTGLIDQICEPAILEDVACDAARGLAAGTLKRKQKKKSTFNKLLEDTPPGQYVLFDQAKKAIDKATDGKYPAAYAILDCVKEGLKGNKKAGLEYEAKRFVEMAQTPQSAGLIGLFDGMTACKKNTFGKPQNETKTVAVLGAGLMGAGIAEVTAKNAGLRVLLKDRDIESASRGEGIIEGNFDRAVKRKRMTKHKRDSTLANVIGLGDDTASWGKHFNGADMVIEAVFEDLSLKHKVIESVEEHLPEHAVFATNTSAIPIRDIAKGSKRPENVVGMHYFSPVPQMPLLEIIPHEGTADHVSAAAFEVGTKQGKTCITVKDVPGFYVNRCLGPFLIEVQAVLQAGTDPLELDANIKDMGMPMGPITLADMVGIDVAGHVAKFLSNADMGVRMEGASLEGFEMMNEKGFLGKKSGKGFFLHEGLKKGQKPPINPEAVAMLKQFLKEDLKLSKEEQQLRIFTRFVNEAIKCLEDEIIADPLTGDIGAVFGIGFPPFMGGPFRMMDNYEGGITKFHDTMCGFRDKYGEQFEPCDMMAEYAKTNKKFHSN